MPADGEDAEQTQPVELIRIVLADDHEVVRTGLRMLLDSQPDFEVVAEASDTDRRPPLRARPPPQGARARPQHARRLKP